MPKISVIVPCYNQAQYLSEALESVLAQTYTNWECIIVNDGSPDNTEETAMAWCEKDVRIKYFKKENGGVSSARNFGISNSTGEYILPLDADDKIHPEYLFEACAILDNKKDIGIVYSLVEKFGEESGLVELPEYSLEKMLAGNLINNSSVFRRSDYNRTNGYNINMLSGLEDWDFLLTFIELGVGVFQIKKLYFYYRINKKSRNNSIDFYNAKALNKQIFLNHLNLYATHFHDPINLYYENQSQARYIKYLRDRILLIQNSMMYKTGELLIRPFRYIKHLIKPNTQHQHKDFKTISKYNQQ